MGTRRWVRLPAGSCVGVLLGICGAVGLTRAGGPPDTQAAAEQGLPVELEALLDGMEAAGARIRDLRARVRYGGEELLVASRTDRLGTLALVREGGAGGGAGATARFLVHFKIKIVDGEAEREDEYYGFDGQDLVSRKDKVKVASRERIVRPGETLDPLRLDGPFPVPFGQKKSELLVQFSVTEEAVRPELVQELVRARAVTEQTKLRGLLLTSRPGSSMAGRTQWVRLVVDEGTHLPVWVQSREGQDRQKTALFSAVEVNTGLGPSDVRVDVPEDFTWAEPARPQPAD